MDRRAIPAVEKVLQALGTQPLPRSVVLHAVRHRLDLIRAGNPVPERDVILRQIREDLSVLLRSRLQPVVNGTGIVIHTNLGRSPLARPVARFIGEIAESYLNLEFDLDSGERGSRGEYVERCLALICETEAAAIVNNCAAALVLALRHFTAKKREVIISRGELVQIGGGFRIPEILETSGAVLREVGTTNRTTLRDYEKAIGPKTGLLLKVHHSNFRMTGFVESATRAELGQLAKGRRIPFLEDLGSGALVRTEALPGLSHEPTPSEVLRAGADLVCFSGDKLFGGPQAGILAGQEKHVRALKQDPFFRALRPDKLIFAAMQANAELCLRGLDDAPIPVLQMLRDPVERLRARAESILLELPLLAAKITLGEAKSQPGGGTLPETNMESVTIDILPGEMSASQLAHELRRNVPPVIARVADGKVRIDLRTVFPEQDGIIIHALVRLLAQPRSGATQRQITLWPDLTV